MTGIVRSAASRFFRQCETKARQRQLVQRISNRTSFKSETQSRSMSSLANYLARLLGGNSLTPDSSKVKQGTMTWEPCHQLQETLASSEFTIFNHIGDLGYFGWSPDTTSPYKNMAKVSAEEIKRGIVLSATPPRVLTVSALNSKNPCTFYYHLPPQSHKNRFPYCPSYETSLYVAVQERGVDVNDVDFVFGGSTLEVLCNPSSILRDKVYLAKMIPATTDSGKATVMVTKHDEYVRDLTAWGFQFRRFVVGKRFEDSHDFGYVEHLNLMEVGGRYKVLLTAEVDTVDEHGDSSVEITLSNPRYWGTKKMFQMMSSGSLSLYSGIKQRNVLTRVQVSSFSQMMKDATQRLDVTKLERSILEGLDVLQKGVESGLFRNGEAVLQLKPLGANGVELQEYSDKDSAPFLSNAVTKELLGCY